MELDGPIVIAKNNRQQFCVHLDVDRAIKEAERLAMAHGGEFIVYVPVAVSRPAPKVVTVRISDVPF
jgi:hypothetical protein